MSEDSIQENLSEAEMKEIAKEKADERRRLLKWERLVETCTKAMDTVEQFAITGFYLQISKVGLMFAIWITLWIKL